MNLLGIFFFFFFEILLENVRDLLMFYWEPNFQTKKISSLNKKTKSF